MTDPRNWTEEQLNDYLRRFAKWGGAVETAVDAAFSLANLEPDSKPISKRPDESKNLCPRYRVHIHSRRHRLTDTDAICAKNAIDGLVRGGILKDDTAATVESLTFTQEKSETEETLIEVWEILLE